MSTPPISVSSHLKPGNSFEYCSGIVLSFYHSNDYVYGTFLTSEGKIFFKSYNPFVRERILCGFRLEFVNGYCYLNKSRHLTVTEGKFGESSLSIDPSFYSSCQTNIFCKVTGFYDCSGNLCLSAYSLVPYKKYTFIIRYIPDLFPSNSVSDLVGNILKINGFYNGEVFIPSFVNVLPFSHFLYIFDKLLNGDFELLFHFSFQIEEYFSIIAKYYKKFKDLLFQKFSNISKNNLSTLEQILSEKFFNSDLYSLSKLLEPPSNVDDYYSIMFSKIQQLLVSYSTITNVTDFLTFLKWWYPAYQSIYL